MDKNRSWTIFTLILLLAVFCFLVVCPQIPSFLPLSSWFSAQKFHLGLDLRGGTELIYEAETKDIPEKEIEYAVAGAAEVIERRVNVFGVAEPQIQTAKTETGSRIIVALPGIKNVSEAMKMIGETPVLDFREIKQDIVFQLEEGQIEEEKAIEDIWLYTGLTGKYLKSAIVDFDPQTNEPVVSLEFNKEGAKLFGNLTSKNVGQPLAIFLDNQLISAPTVREPITSGRAQISGRFDLKKAKELASRLSAGALPLPIKLINQQTIGASLGEESIRTGLLAAILGFLGVILFMILNYRQMGFLASIALLIYLLINLSWSLTSNATVLIN